MLPEIINILNAKMVRRKVLNNEQKFNIFKTNIVTSMLVSKSLCLQVPFKQTPNVWNSQLWTIMLNKIKKVKVLENNWTSLTKTKLYSLG